MLKIDCNEGKVRLEMKGNLQSVCAELSTIIHAIEESLREENDFLADTFRELFTKGYMDGICFGTDRKTMEEYLAKADENFECEEDVRTDIKKELKELVGMIADLLNEKENDDAAE